MHLSKIARDAVAAFPHSDIEVAMRVCPDKFCSESNDRLLKLGRRVSSLVRDFADDDKTLEAGLQSLWQESDLIASGVVKVPTVRFGKTGASLR
jgi:hypothetical protein